jgi:hypothetical protein
MHFDRLRLKSTNKSRTTWNIVTTITNNTITTSNIPPMNINNWTTNPSIIANAFNYHFCSVSENLITKIFFGKNTTNDNPLTYLRQNFIQSFPAIRLNNTTIHEISKIIQSLKCKDSNGYDGDSTRILQISAPYILSPLIYIFNKTLSNGIFPDRLKFSELKLFKKGASTECSNYRSISLLNSLLKNYIQKIASTLKS